MNILYISHISCLRVENDIPMFEKAGHKVTLLNNHRTHFKAVLSSYPQFKDIINLYNNDEFTYGICLKDILGKALKKILAHVKLDNLFITNYLREKWDMYRISHVSNKVKLKIAKIIEEKDINLVYAAWGTTVFEEINAIKQLQVDVPIVWSIQSYPLREYRLSSKSNIILKKEKEIIENIEGRIHCSKQMYDYFSKNFNLKKYGNDVIYPGYWRKNYFYRKQLPKLTDIDNEFHLVFIGDTNFSQRTFNDIRSQIKEISNKHIHIHFAKTRDKLFGNESYIHMFEKEKIENGDLATFMTQFDACIVMYNIDRKYLRYEISLPERFLFTLAAGVPIVCPAGYYQACQDFIMRHKIGFVYEDVNELKDMLENRTLIRECNINASKLKEKLVFENNYVQLENFFRKAMETNRKL